MYRSKKLYVTNNVSKHKLRSFGKGHRTRFVTFPYRNGEVITPSALLHDDP